MLPALAIIVSTPVASAAATGFQVLTDPAGDALANNGPASDVTRLGATSDATQVHFYVQVNSAGVPPNPSPQRTVYHIFFTLADGTTQRAAEVVWNTGGTFATALRGTNGDQIVDGVSYGTVTAAWVSNELKVDVNRANIGNPTDGAVLSNLRVISHRYTIPTDTLYDRAADTGGAPWTVGSNGSVSTTAPGAPTGLAATASDAQVSLSWTAPANDGGAAITSYSIYRGTTPGGETLLTTTGSTSTTHVDTGLTNGQAYYYTVAATNSVGTGPQSGEASATPSASPPPPPPTGVSFRNFPAPDQREFRESGEPTLGVNWNTGNVMIMTGGYPLLNLPPEQHVSRVTFSADGTQATWTDVTPDFLVTNLDPILETDHVTGRTYAGGDDGACNILGVTTDDGQTWLPATNSCTHVAEDHPTVGAGPASPNGPVAVGGPLNPDGRAAYLCQDNAPGTGLTACAVTWDGGVTWGQTTPVRCPNYVNPGSLGHLQVGPDGNAYVPINNCENLQGVSHSYDGGISWAGVQVPGVYESTIFSDPALAVGRGNEVNGGRLFFAAAQGDGAGAAMGHPVVAVSNDKGLTWSAPVDLAVAGPRVSGDAIGVKTAVFPTVVAGDDDRAAFAFHGTKTAGDAVGRAAGASNFAGVWHLYVAMTYDGGDTWTTYDVTPDDPVQRGCISLGGTLGANCDTRNLLDFMDVQIDARGRVIVAYADGSLPGCTSHACSQEALAVLARQSGGKTLFAAFDDGGPSNLVANAGSDYAGSTGSAIALEATATGGTAPYSFAWSVLTAPTGSAGGSFGNANAAVTTFTPDVAGLYSLSVALTDAAGASTSATASLVANSDHIVGCRPGGAALAIDGTEDGGTSGDATEAFCLRAADTASTVEFFLDLKGRDVGPGISADAPVLFNMFFSASNAGGDVRDAAQENAPFPLQSYNWETSWDGNALRTGLFSYDTGTVIVGETVTAEWVGATLHLIWDRSGALAPADGDRLSSIQVVVQHCDPDCLTATPEDDFIPDSGFATAYTVGDDGTTGGDPLPLCGDELGLDPAGDSTQPSPGKGLRDLVAVAASDTEASLTFCWTVVDYDDRPTGTDDASKTDFTVFFTAPYEGPGVAYSITATINSDGTVDAGNSGWMKGACDPGPFPSCLTGIASGPATVTVAGDVIRASVERASIGNPQTGDSMTGLSVDTRPFTDRSTSQDQKDNLASVEDFEFGQTVPADTTPPSQVTGLAVTDPQTGDQLDLSWDLASDNVGVTNYRVFRDGVEVGTPTTNAWNDAGLTEGVSYAYTVQAEDAAGNLGAASAVVSGTPTHVDPVDTTPPSVPQDLAACGTSTSTICIEWTASTDDLSGVSHYRVFRNGELRGTTSATAFEDVGLAFATTYTYTVSAVDNVGLESGQSTPLAVTTLGFTGPEISITAPTDGATTAPPLTIAGTYSTTGREQTPTSRSLEDSLPWTTEEWLESSFVSMALDSDEFAETLADLSELEGFHAAYPTPEGTIRAYLAGATPILAPTETPSGWPIVYVENVGMRMLTEVAAGLPTDVVTLDDIRSGRAAPPSMTPGVQDGIGPGSALQMHNPIDGQNYICTASFLFEDPETGDYYLQTAGHCLMDTTQGNADSVAQPQRKVDSVSICYTGCISNPLGIGTYVELPRTADYDPVAWAHHGGVGDDAGYIRIPSELNGFLRPWMTFWSGPTGSGATQLGDAVVHFGHGISTGTTTPTQARAGVVNFRDTTSFDAVGAISGGDSGSSVAIAGVSGEDRITGAEAMGIATHGATFGLPIPGALWSGTTFERALDMAEPSLGFRPVLVTQDAEIRPPTAVDPVTLNTAITSPASGASIAEGDALAVTGTATYPVAVEPGTGSLQYFLARDQCGAPQGQTDIDDNPHLVLTAPAVAGNCGSAAQPVGPVWEAVLGPIADAYPAEPAPVADTYVDMTRAIEARVYFSCNGRIGGAGACAAPSVVNDIEVKLSYGGTLVGSQRLTNSLILSDTAVGVDFSFMPLVDSIPLGQTPTLTVQVHQAAGPVFTMWGGATASYVTLPLGTVAPRGVDVYVDVLDSAHLVATTGTTSWSAEVPASLLAAGSHTIYARATNGATADATPATVSVTVVGVQHTPPSASFTTVIDQLALDVTDTSTAGDSAIVGWAWDFGDGATATGPTASHTFADDGTYRVTLVVTDANGLTDAASADVTVAGTHVWSVGVRILDSEGAEVLGQRSAGDVAEGDGTWSYFWDAAPEPGTYTIEAQLMRDGVAKATTTSTFTVPFANRAPVLDPIGGRTVTEGETVAFTVTASDPDGNGILRSATGVPSGATWDPVTGAFAWTPGLDAAGTYLVHFEVSDGEYSDSEDVEIVVLDYVSPNNAPVFDVVSDKTTSEGAPVTFTVTASDPDGDAVTLGASGLPAGATFDSVTGVFSWTPDYRQAGVHDVVFSASDGDLMALDTVRVSVVNVPGKISVTRTSAAIVDTSPGTPIVATFLVKNTGAAPDTISLTAFAMGAPGWTATPDVTSVALLPGESRTVSVSIVAATRPFAAAVTLKGVSSLDGPTFGVVMSQASVTVRLPITVDVEMDYGTYFLQSPVTGVVRVAYLNGAPVADATTILTEKSTVQGADLLPLARTVTLKTGADGTAAFALKVDQTGSNMPGDHRVSVVSQQVSSASDTTTYRVL